jgi:hypothetical protein
MKKRMNRANATKPSTSKASPSPRSKMLGLLKYKIQDVKGDGNCFYRAMYHVLKESPSVQVQLGIEGTYMPKAEREAVRIIRQRVADSIANNTFANTTLIINNLCELSKEVPNMIDMYPFLTKDVCNAKGALRYNKIGAQVKDTTHAMYASSLELNVVQNIIRGLTILVISTIEGDSRRSKTSDSSKWKHDLTALLKTVTTQNVAVLLNDDNTHYQYLAFKGPGDDKYHTVLNRQRFRSILDGRTEARSVAASPPGVPIVINSSSSGSDSKDEPKIKRKKSCTT